MSIGVIITKIITFFYKMCACRPSPDSWLDGCSSTRPVHYY